MTAVVTGIGVVAPTGLGAHSHWKATCGGKAAIGPVTAFDASCYSSTLAGQVTGFDPEGHLPRRLLPQTDHMTRLALVAADWALADANVDPSEVGDYGAGVVTASSGGGFEFGHRELDKLWRSGPQHVSAYQSFAWFYAVNTGQISIRNGFRGPSGVLVTEQAGGLDAIGQARRRIRAGQTLMVGGGVDGSPCPWGWVAQIRSGALSTRVDPARAYLPFDVDAAGHVPGDGGALFVLESEESARRRGRGAGYGRIAGYASTFDPPPGSGRPSTLGRAIHLALRDAGVGPSDVGVVFADGAGTAEADRAEAQVLREVFGPHGVPVTVPKTMTGRLAAGGAALDVATALLAIRHRTVPPTVNVTPDPTHGIDLVVEPRRLERPVALVVARGAGGFNAAMTVIGPENTPEGSGPAGARREENT